MRLLFINLTFLIIFTEVNANETVLLAPDGTTVTIHRDEFGVPHITGDTEVAVFYGQGFAVAEDRLFQLEMNRRGAEGRISELLGIGFLDWDRYIRQMGYTVEEMTEMFTAFPVELQDMAEAYTAGINTFLDTMVADPTQYKPFEFFLLNIDMEPWTVLNTLAVGIFMVRDFGMFGGQELDRLSELQTQGKEWFDENRPINDPNAPTTISEGGMPTPTGWSYSGIRVREEIIQKINIRKKEIERLKKEIGLPPKFGSFAVLTSPEKSSSGNVMLLGCPQMGEPQENAPQINNEVELTCPTLHVGGMAIAGIPGVIIGHTEHHAWTITSGISDNIDVYIDSTSDASYSQYYHNGEWLDFNVITDTIHIFSASTEIYTHYRTIHGPVFGDDLENHQVFSYKGTFRDRELDMLQFFYYNYKATSLSEFESAAEQYFVMNFNMHYADQDQNIKYWHLGLFQDRSDGVDPRLPHKGDGTEEWGGLIPFTDLPQATSNPEGYFANWNNKPVSWWNHGDITPWVGGHSVELIKDYVGSIDSFTYENLKDIPFNIGSHGTYQQAIEFTSSGIMDENIVPPGQSGFRNWQGIPSPHFDDQWSLHVAWEFKDMEFGEDYVTVTYHVSTTGSDSTGDGTAENPFATIQYGIDIAVSGDTVLVQPGTYVENINFYGKNLVLGSLFMVEEESAYILETVIDGDTSGSVVTFESGENFSVVLCGFTIRNGGGTEAADPMFPGSAALFGGGIYIENASPTIRNNRISDNYLIYSCSNRGGGIAIRGNSNPIIVNNTIRNNIVSGPCLWINYFGGGVWIDSTSNPIIGGTADNTNIFENNYADSGFDLFRAGVGKVVNAQHNQFDHCPPTEGNLVYPDSAFDVSNCSLPPLIVEEDSNLPNEFFLHQNYPNPFNPTTTIRFDLPEAGMVRLVIYNILGKEVAVVVDRWREAVAGRYNVVWDASNVASGVYFYRLVVKQDDISSYVETKKLVVLK
ncbi:MAG: penicillin acylase family protein [Candidatus Marinimicrobia bacterium]|nr:penicillin acylase family protein [Candidatus Neomarinimicrobiota bacterium]